MQSAGSSGGRRRRVPLLVPNAEALARERDQAVACEGGEAAVGSEAQPQSREAVRESLRAREAELAAELADLPPLNSSPGPPDTEPADDPDSESACLEDSDGAKAAAPVHSCPSSLHSSLFLCVRMTPLFLFAFGFCVWSFFRLPCTTISGKLCERLNHTERVHGSVQNKT